jgi:hypothetical protein
MAEHENPEWQPPPPPEHIPQPEPPQMSEVGTLANIFIEPENTFKDLRRKPRFIIAGIIMALLAGAYTFALTMKVGEAAVRSAIAEQIDKSPQAANLPREQKESAIDMQMTVNKYVRFVIPVFAIISFVIGGLLYWAGGKAFGGSGTFPQNLSVWIYSGFPPMIIAMIGNFVVMALKSADDIDLVASQRGMLHANPSFFIDGKAHPVIATFLSTFDVFAIWGWVLAAIGLAVVNKISKASAWSVVLIITLIGLAFRLVGALFSGNPT